MKGRARPVLAATESSDGYTGVCPPRWPNFGLTFAKEIAVEGATATVRRQTEAGADLVECPLPAVVSVTAGVVEPRPSFRGIMQAMNKPVDQLKIADLGRP